MLLVVAAVARLERETQSHRMELCEPEGAGLRGYAQAPGKRRDVIWAHTGLREFLRLCKNSIRRSDLFWCSRPVQARMMSITSISWISENGRYDDLVPGLRASESPFSASIITSPDQQRLTVFMRRSNRTPDRIPKLQ